MNFLDQVKDKRIYIEIPETLGIYIPPNMKEVNNIFSIRDISVKLNFLIGLFLEQMNDFFYFLKKVFIVDTLMANK